VGLGGIHCADAGPVDIEELFMTPKFIRLLEECITDGVVLGHTRAYKHNNDPSTADINESIVREVLNEIHEWFDFDELNQGETK
jgi:hypothetical protein